jgi:putative PEP-CTERM system TPR-repeat lipoprotein
MSSECGAGQRSASPGQRTDLSTLPTRTYCMTRLPSLLTARRLAVCAAAALAGCGAEAPEPKASTPMAQPTAAREEQLAQNSRLIEFKNRIQQDPFSADARHGLALVLLEQANPNAAVQELTKALELGMDPNIVLPVLARTWNLIGQSKTLVDGHANTRLSNPVASAELKAALATAYANLGNPKQARALIDAALQDDPQSPRARVLRAQVTLVDGKLEPALKMLDETISLKPDSGEAWEAKGDILLMAKADVAGATAAYEKALESAPLNLPLQSKLIALALDTQDLETAQARLARLAKLAPYTLPHRFFTARMQAARGQLKEAQETIKLTLTEFPNDLRSLMLAGELHLRAGALRTAEESLAIALTLGPTVPRTRHLLAQTYLRSGTPEKAQMILEPLVRPGRVDAVALGLSGEAALQAGLTHVATQLYERAAAADPRNPRYKTALAIARISKGDFQGGLIELESAAADDPTAYADMALLAARLRLGDIPAAIAAAESVAKKQPRRATPQWALGQLKLSAGQTDAARVHYGRALEIDPAFVPAAVALAQLDTDAKDPAAARRRLEGVLALSPNNLDALLALAEMQHRSGQPANVVTAALQNAVKLHGDQQRARLALINHLIRVDDGAGALLAAQAAATARPEDVSITDALGRAQLAVGETAQALTTFRRVVSARPRAAEPHLRMATVYEVRGETASAIESLKEAVRRNPGLMSAHAKLAEMATAQKDWREALRVARNVQRLFPKAARGYHIEGLVLVAQRQWDPALAAFRNAMEREPSPELALQIHSTLRAAGKPDDAARWATEWLAKRPNDNYFIGYLGELALLNKDMARAESHFRTILNTDPSSVDAMNNLAWLLAQQGKPGAVAMARQALQIQPDRVDVMDTLSMALASENQLPEALANQKRVLERSPNSPALRLNLARLAIQAKDFTLAKSELDALSGLGKDFPAQAEVWELRQQLR